MKEVRWYQLSDGTYLSNCWKKIDGKWYYFKADGYAARSEWVKGYYWLGANCTWTYEPKGAWYSERYGWRFMDSAGWFAKGESVTIDGKEYTFNKKGYFKNP